MWRHWRCPECGAVRHPTTLYCDGIPPDDHEKCAAPHVCPACLFLWDDHVQGRCPDKVAAQEEAFTKVLLVGIICIVLGVIVAVVRS